MGSRVLSPTRNKITLPNRKYEKSVDYLSHHLGRLTEARMLRMSKGPFGGLKPSLSALCAGLISIASPLTTELALCRHDSSFAPIIEARVPRLSAHQRKTVKNPMKIRTLANIPRVYPKSVFPYNKSKSLVKT